MKLIFTPFSIVLGLVAGSIGRKIFTALWGVVDKEEAPDASQRDVTWPKVLAASAVEGAVFRVTKVSADRALRKGFLSLTGSWPGEAKPDPK